MFIPPQLFYKIVLTPEYGETCILELMFMGTCICIMFTTEAVKYKKNTRVHVQLVFFYWFFLRITFLLLLNHI